MSFTLHAPESIQPNPWNSNIVSHENEEKLAESIRRVGFFKPIVVRELPNGSLQCLGGWHRCQQAIELGIKQVPTFSVGVIDDTRAKEISLADNARYGVDDTLRLSEIIEDLDTDALETFMPWSSHDIEAMIGSLGVDLDDLDLEDPDLPDDDDPEEAPAPKAPKTHQVMRFRNSLDAAARISDKIKRTMIEQGFTKEDDLTNAGDALAYLLLGSDSDV